MIEKTKINHVALNSLDKEKADIFFKQILGLDLKKTFTISPDLSQQIFGIKEEIQVLSYENEYCRFEIFITKEIPKLRFDHTCIMVKDKQNFIERCKKHKIEPICVKRNDKILLFVRDLSNNLYEVKEA